VPSKIQERSIVMHRSFGMETRPRRLATWSDVMRGPTRAEVTRHIRKLANYPVLMGTRTRGR
jgi:hypothetical protein